MVRNYEINIIYSGRSPYRRSRSEWHETNTFIGYGNIKGKENVEYNRSNIRIRNAKATRDYVLKTPKPKPRFRLYINRNNTIIKTIHRDGETPA
jgi:hypothetical protein